MTSTKKPVFVITGAAGTGKTTISDYLAAQYGIKQVITHTTRPPRDGEVDGVNYYFETETSFKTRHYLESVEYSGYHYGSSFEGLERGLADAPAVSIVLDTKGAATYLKELPEQAVVLFLTVTNTDLLADRIQNRGDNLMMMKQRLASAEYHRDLTLPADLQGKAIVIHNDNWAETASAVDAIVAARLVKDNA